MKMEQDLLAFFLLLMRILQILYTRGEVKRTLELREKLKSSLKTLIQYTGLFISPSGISELDCATTKTDTVERSISIGRESLQVFFLY